MNPTRALHHRPADTLLDSLWVPHVEAFKRRLIEGRYSPHTAGTYVACIAHFAYWSAQRDLDIPQINEVLVREFLDDHLPGCDCTWPVRRVRSDVRAALGHFLSILRANAAIPEPTLDATPVDAELRRFDDHLEKVRGLASQTRCQYLRIVRDFLIQQFAGQPIAIPVIRPDEVRQFLAGQGRLYTTPASLSVPVSALRGYFRFRTFCGDSVHHLIGVVNYPAHWQQAALPKALSRGEVERLQKALDAPAGVSRRDIAIVRCALDLGLRSREVARLGLDDIDWRAGTLTLRETKSRRADVLPLPEATGQALADYLKLERPTTTHRAVFVRHAAPYDRPIGPDLVRKVIRQAYARAGLPYTRSHLLRHTLAGRLLDGGSPLKEVADVLRHRSLNTTLVYAKLDGRNLAAVALPWPGSAL